MAQYVHGPSGPTGMSPPTPTTDPRFSQTPAGLPDVKEELYNLGEHNHGTPLFADKRSIKRRKVEQDSKSSHKFISQKKWKFSDGQPWLPSKLSSKAQNASKASRRNKTEPVSPKRSSSPVVLSSMQVFDSNQVHTQPHGENIAIFRAASCSSETSEMQYTTREDARRLDNVTSNTNGNQIAKTSFSLEDQTVHVVTQPSAEVLRHSTSPSAGITCILPGRSRSARNMKALSLEKDAERIAALMAEKRKENESSMFRERILQRRREQSTRDTEAECASLSPTINTTPSNAIPSVQTNAEYSKENSPSRDTSTSSKSANKAKQQDRQYGQTTPGKTSSAPAIGEGVGSFSGMQDARNEQSTQSSYNMETPARPTSEHDAHVNLFRDQPLHRPSSKNSRNSSHMTAGLNTTTLKPHTATRQPDSGFPPNATQPVVASTTFQTTDKTQVSQAEQVGRKQQARDVHWKAQNSSTPQNAHPQTNHQSAANRTYNGRHIVERVIQPASLPTNFASSQSPTTIPVHHFSQIEISPHSYQHDPIYRSNTGQHRYATNGQVLTNPAMYYNSGQMHLPEDQRHANQFNMGNQTAYGTSIPAQNVTSALSAPPPATLQHLPQPRVMSSNTNMFSGNVRSSAGNGMGVMTPKPRVNMFSNTKGTPFPVHEVIRQIEMT